MINSLNNQAIEQQNSQNVLVGALCNQFVKNNIKTPKYITYLFDKSKTDLIKLIDNSHNIGTQFARP